MGRLRSREQRLLLVLGGIGVKTNVYVDALNLYYGAVRGTAHKWLDIRRMCELLLPKCQINKPLGSRSGPQRRID